MRYLYALLGLQQKQSWWREVTVTKIHSRLWMTDIAGLLRGAGFNTGRSYWKGTLKGPWGKVTGRWGWRPWRKRSYLNLIFVENQSHQTPVDYSLNYRFFLNLSAFLTVKSRLPGTGAAVSLKPTLHLIWTCARTQKWLCRLRSSGRNEHVCSPRTLGGTYAVQETRRFQLSKLGKKPRLFYRCDKQFSNMHGERPRCRLLQVRTVVSGPCGSFSVRADLQNGIKTAPNKTAAAANNNIHLLFNLKCQLAKQAVALQPKCALEESQLARLPRAREASYRDTGNQSRVQVFWVHMNQILQKWSWGKPTSDACSVNDRQSYMTLSLRFFYCL